MKTGYVGVNTIWAKPVIQRVVGILEFFFPRTIMYEVEYCPEFESI